MPAVSVIVPVYNIKTLLPPLRGVFAGADLAGLRGLAARRA